ncbi:sulfite exporter TauE/SafE family protein [Bdellovibrio sp. HCB-110]|uniref:sulfite exporter TauE/SafE family protein n=1 Tax=Bdellovibrio sp. HCB-110 TaxID=3391182 RepID=UPI0039B4B4A8
MNPTILLVLGILSSSFFGSWHCAGMCGPIASLMSTKKSLLSYHLGRLISYTALGLASGALGQFFLNNDFVILRWASGGLLAMLLLISGFTLIFPPSSVKKSNSLRQLLWDSIKKVQAFHIGRSGFVVGLLTVFLPCGWLYTYAMAAIATRSPWAGALTLFLFWLGGLPTLSAVPLMVRKTIQSAGLRQQRIAGLVLVVSGLYSLGSFMFLH